MEVIINVKKPEIVGNVIYYRLCALPSNVRIMETTSIDKIYEHLRWLVEVGVAPQKLAVLEIHGTEYKRVIEISEKL